MKCVHSHTYNLLVGEYDEDGIGALVATILDYLKPYIERYNLEPPQLPSTRKKEL